MHGQCPILTLKDLNECKNRFYSQCFKFLMDLAKPKKDVPESDIPITSNPERTGRARKSKSESQNRRKSNTILSDHGHSNFSLPPKIDTRAKYVYT